MDKFLSNSAIEYLLSFANVVGIGYGFKEVNGQSTDSEAIMVMVTKKIPENELAECQIIPKLIEGIVTDVIAVGKVTIHKVQNKFDSQANDIESRQSRWRPAPGGVSIGHYKITAGTLGAIVYGNYTNMPLILSNNHVLANSTNGKDHRAKIGDPILQPGPLDGGTVKNDKLAKLYRFVPLKDNSLNVVDAAVAKPLKPKLVVPEILEIGKIKGVILPKVGMKVKKSGRTTGLTHAHIRAIHVMITVDYDGRLLKFKDQILTDPFDEPGDSGSLVLNEYNWVVGLLFAGSEESTIINPIAPVLELLHIHF
ncbi:MAG: hypothetical protein ACM3X1_01570 [Ignavibacteriales bacterium]